MVMDDIVNTDKKVDADNYFVVRGQMWSPEDQDYTLGCQELTKTYQFDDFKAAFAFFNTAEYPGASGESQGDIKLDLNHFRFGKPTMIRTRVLFPS